LAAFSFHKPLYWLLLHKRYRGFVINRLFYNLYNLPMLKQVICCGILLSGVSTAFAQSVSDTTFVSVAAQNTVKIYEDFISIHSGLINGSEYSQPRFNDTQFPFYLQVDWLPGEVTYNDERYRDVSLLYDLAGDNVIVENPVNGQEIQLVKARVSSFTINGDRFVHIRKHQLAGLPQEGFYQMLYSGKSGVLVRHFKIFEEKIENREITFYYRERKRIYARIGDAFVRVNRRGDLLKLVGDKKDEVRSYIRKNKIKVSSKNPGSFSDVVEYFDTL
jgi:hypothetical protein